MEKDVEMYLKTVAVGFGCVGKTSLFITWVDKEFPSEYMPTVYESYSQEVTTSDGKTAQLSLYDTGGGEDYHRLRPLSYPETDVFILCFDVAQPGYYFEQLESEWYTELHHHCPDVPIILVGTKIDLRDDESVETLSTEQGKAMAEKIKAAEYMEISSLRKEGLDGLFVKVVDIGYEHLMRSKSSKCRKCLLL